MKGRLRAFGLFVSVLLLVLVGGVITLFLVQNGHWVVVRFPELSRQLAQPLSLSEWEAPLSVVMAGAFLVGGVVASLIYFPLWFRRSVERNRDRRFIDNLEGELTDMRNLPLTDPAPLEDIDDGPEVAADRRGEQDDDEALLMDLLQQSDRAIVKSGPPR